ncbi:MAG TPA: 5-dehydro-4-deoxy-D-glucuronate isomerase [Microbacterium sp.]|uniref:5-dehydro-4-deoxy-D-glucuronate isomerase n=1 Tax=Microbacterium sp. TaxID=51671 RepID=UPI002F95C407
MKIQHATHPDDLAGLDDDAIRSRFLEDGLFVDGQVTLTYTHHDRMILGGVALRAGESVELPVPTELRSATFCQRRELAVVSVGGSADVTVDGTSYRLVRGDVLYIGRGAGAIGFAGSEDGGALFLASALAHTSFPTRLVRLADASATAAGALETANRRIIHKHLHADGVQTAQLVLGITALEPGSVWNSMPPHLHDRRTEAYLYFDLPADHRIAHYMGTPGSVRTITMKNLEAVVSPSWSLHFGTGTTNYAFVWVMAGENQDFADMDQIAVTDL